MNYAHFMTHADLINITGIITKLTETKNINMEVSLHLYMFCFA